MNREVPGLPLGSNTTRTDAAPGGMADGPPAYQGHGLHLHSGAAAMALARAA